MPDESAPAASLRGFVESAREPVWLLGDGAQLVDEALNGTGKTRLYPRSRLGRAGVCRAALAAGETVPAAQLIPDTTAFRRRSGNGRRNLVGRALTAQKDKKTYRAGLRPRTRSCIIWRNPLLGADHGGLP